MNRIDKLITSNDPRQQNRAIRTIAKRACGFSVETLVFLKTERERVYKKLSDYLAGGSFLDTSFDEVAKLAVR